MERKSYFILALALATIICSGTYAYAFNQTPVTMSLLTSRDPQEWEWGWSVTPELYCEAIQR